MRYRSLVVAAIGLALTIGPASGCWGSASGDGTREGRDGTASEPDVADTSRERVETEVTSGPTLRLGRPDASGDGFEPYAEQGAEIELVHGFQGGYHVEPTLHVGGMESGPPDGEATYVVTERSTGERVNRSARYPVGPRSWKTYREGYLHYSNPVVLDIEEPSEITGTQVELSVTLELEEAKITAAVDATIVDEDGE